MEASQISTEIPLSDLRATPTGLTAKVADARWWDLDESVRREQVLRALAQSMLFGVKQLVLLREDGTPGVVGEGEPPFRLNFMPSMRRPPGHTSK